MASLGGSIGLPQRRVASIVEPAPPAVAAWRGRDDFAGSVARLELAVLDAAAQRVEWPAKVAAGIRAALDFATDNPEAARVLALEVRASGSARDYAGMIELFGRLLASKAPGKPDVASTVPEQALIGGIAAVVARHLRAGHLDRLDQVAPELVYLTLLPYVGFDEAKRWAGGPAGA
jgi:hypothetical protein